MDTYTKDQAMMINFYRAIHEQSSNMIDMLRAIDSSNWQQEIAVMKMIRNRGREEEDNYIDTIIPSLHVADTEKKVFNESVELFDLEKFLSRGKPKVEPPDAD